MLLVERVKNRSVVLSEQITEAKKMLHNLPPGRLECHRVENRYRWYVVKNGNREYLKKTELSLAKRLAYKRKMKLNIVKMEHELLALETFIEQIESAPKGIDRRLLDENKEVNRLSQLYIEEKFPERVEWQSAPGESMNWKSEEKRVKSKSGVYFRSKDEAMIDDALYEHGLLVRYEDKLELGKNVEYPDFHIMDPKTGKTIYWEHFGMMDLPNYRRRATYKLRCYMEFGYYPMINFITTFMGDPFRIDEQWIETIIEYFFE